MSFLSQANYERLIYTLPQDYPDVISSSLHLYTASRGTAVIRGSVHFRNGLELHVNETVDFIEGKGFFPAMTWFSRSTGGYLTRSENTMASIVDGD